MIDANSVSRSTAPQPPAMAIQTDGKLVLGGFFDQIQTTASRDFLLIRLNTDGSLDAGFGNKGVLNADVNNLDNEVNAIAIQTDGKIVVAGSTGNYTSYMGGQEVFIQSNSKIKLDKVFRRKMISSRTGLNSAQTVTQWPARHLSGRATSTG